jgi:hypothetical protein
MKPAEKCRLLESEAPDCGNGASRILNAGQVTQIGNSEPATA